MVGDETGVYLTVDSTLQVYPGSMVLSKAITLRKFSALTGAEEWSRDVWMNASLGSPFGAFLAMDFSGIYVSVNEALTASTRKATVRKYHRNGDLLWTKEITTSTQESIMAIAAANGSVYAITYAQSTGNTLYGIDPITGTVLFSKAAGPGEQVNRLSAGPSGIYSFGGLNPARLRKYDLSGDFVWERTIGTGQFVALALLVHPNGIYAGGESLGSRTATLVRLNDSGTTLFQLTIPPNSGGGTTIYSIAGLNDGVLVGGSAQGGLPGQLQYGDADAFVRKYSFDGTVVQWTAVFGGPGFRFTASDLAMSQGGLQLYGLTDGTWPGNTTSTGFRAGLARLNLPDPPQRSLASILASITHPSGNGLKNRANALCNQLDALLRDVQRQPGLFVPVTEAELAVAKIVEIKALIGCTP